MDRKDQIKVQVREVVELLPDLATAAKVFDPSSAISQIPAAIIPALAFVGNYAKEKLKGKGKSKPAPLGKPGTPRGIPGILTTRQRS